MNKNTLGGEAFEGKGPVDPLAPVTRGLEFVEDHHRFWLTGDHGFITPGALATLRSVTDRVVILDDLPEHVDVNPDLRASTHRYPPIRSEMPFLGLNEMLELIHSAYGQPDNPNPT